MKARLSQLWGLKTTRAAALGPFQRLWRGFLTGRVMLSFAILFLLLIERFISNSVSERALWLTAAYFFLAVAARLVLGPQEPKRAPAIHWIFTLGIDMLVCGLLMQWHTSADISLIPLLGLPVLMAAALGNFTVLIGTVLGAFGTLAWVTLWPHGMNVNPQQVLQSVLAGMGFLVLGLLVHQMALRLSGEEQEGKKSRAAAIIQSQVNALVISKLSDGVLVLDQEMLVHSANPAALDILGLDARSSLPFSLDSNPIWQPLLVMAKITLRRGLPQTADLALLPQGGSPMGVHVRSWLTNAEAGLALDRGKGHCVMFLQDLRQVEAQIRTEKLASMGRMSAAVAHEIRNPLTAIIQANALLAEDLTDPQAQRLTDMVKHNADRLRRIAEDILDVARVQRQAQDNALVETLPLDEWSAECVHDWQQQDRSLRVLKLQLQAQGIQVGFDRDHLRRILVNLLDNAMRYKGPHTDSLQITTRSGSNGQASLTVWSDGAPLERSVEQHLFEPFFSSESRSSGLGLFLCRELCERHGAVIGYQRAEMQTARGRVSGNAFTVLFKRPVKDRSSQLGQANALVV
ncbi:HAMP domain-containing histidine kinase [Lampropedia aestuarii]|uniref:histidine kinase n=1 Tax=Lampropedia aestuarii TaxID=2562762 RepID=A0A4S5BSR8_9BURK|nr:HAMP domain-containing sensor histidine kinase [Lampropedia aestuarii]THJ34025.1 HAMP domain-containing histidine kinase [Lampropedia aestuarii]